MTISIKTPDPRLEDLGRETRASAALVLVALAVAVTISLVGLAIS